MDKTKKVIFKVTTLAVLFASAFMFINPVVADTNIDFSATIDPSFSVVISNANTDEASVAIDNIMPSSMGTLRYSDLEVAVYSNADTGYIVNMTTTSTALVGEHNLEEIETLDEKDGGYTIDSFTSDRWGYSVGRTENGEKTFTNFYPVKLGANVITASHGMANGEKLTVRLGAKLDYLASPDTYTTTLNFNIVANIEDL